jgi:hypothetical protein
MLEKLTPLIVLALFAVAAVVIIQGLNTAQELAHPKTTEKRLNP